MDVTQAILYPQPPPTSNNLDAHQRARLVRSTRKLGALLGTTPHLLDLQVDVEAYFPPTYIPDTPQSVYHTKRARRHASVFSVFPHMRTTPTTTDDELSSASSSIYASASSSKNSSVTSFALDTDTTPRTSLDSTESHAHSMTSIKSKVRKTDTMRPRPLILRLNAIPVAPSDPRLPLSPLPQTPPTRSTSLKTDFDFIDAEPPMTPMTPTIPTPSELRRRKMAKLTRTLGENVPPELVFSSRHHQPAQSQSQLRVETPRRRRAGSKSVDENARGVRPSSQIWVTGMQGWRGEWNRKDIREVQQGLRNLKSR
ncbi:hypothetical protein EUX98_g6230 [Antrodiella citrinella]|uniref:Uncharacterized protein n=1 Tax=Antrodiella citrinella TaxID=2447956 RepID=A0A4S4MX25_9APHY|nr:hypothetical protein EUX98_g6230 [Antrodiella citrinella]